MSEGQAANASAAGEEVENLRELLHRVVDKTTDPALLAELYYYSAEPELLCAMRSYIAMPSSAKKLLALFFEITHAHPETIAASVHVNGDLTLSSPASVGLAELIAHGALAAKTVTPVQ